MKIIEKGNGMFRIIAENGLTLIRKGQPFSGSVFSEITVLERDKDNWEEIEIPPYTQDEYIEEVRRRIALEYRIEDEMAILRQRDTKPGEFEAYNAYAEQCKADAKACLLERAEKAGEGKEES